MWKWILGAMSLAGVAGAAYAARSDKREPVRDSDPLDPLNMASLDGGRPPPRRSERKHTAPVRRPELADAKASYWDVMNATDEPGLDRQEKERRDQARILDTEALARIIASEAGPMSRKLKHTVGWVARNRSLLLKRPMFEMAAPGDRWGPISEIRPMSSSQPATEETRAIAAAVLSAPQQSDPTGGATHGFDVTVQDRLAEQGMRSNDAAGVMEIWKTYYGLDPIGQVETWVLYR